MRVFVGSAWLAAACLLVVGAGSAVAQEVPVEAPAPQAERRLSVQPRFGLDFLVGGVRSATVATRGTDDQLRALQLNVGLTAYRVLDVSAEFGVGGMGDTQPFTQETTGGEKESSVAAGIATLALGLRTPALSLGGTTPVRLSVGAGVGHTLMDASRSISQCMDCHVEYVAVDAGNFWESGLHLTRGQHGLSARFRRYGNESDMQDAVMIGYTLGRVGR